MTMTDEQRLAALDRIAEEVATLRAEIAATRAELVPEPTATVEAMTVGGWMKLPGSPRWRPIDAITACRVGEAGACWRIDFDLPATDRDGTFVHVGRDDEFPFLTAEQFDAACTREQAAA